jgi:8-oxo-dGTP pyrophosphatase MutT (NUDIX family)
VAFERTGGETVYEGLIATVRVETFRHDDGEEVKREFIAHPGAVVMLAHDGERLFLVRQPREAAGEEALLELPAGKLDEEGEDLEETVQRELAEEIGKRARSVEHLKTFYSSPGFTDETMHLYLCTDLYDEQAEAGENERIEIVEWPLARLDDAIAECGDAKSLIGLLWLKACIPRDGGGAGESTSWPTWSSSAGCRATPSRPTAPTSSSTGASSTSGA